MMKFPFISQIRMLPTSKSELFANNEGKLYVDRYGKTTFTSPFQPQHLYFTVDEAVGHGDWFLELDPTGKRSSYTHKPYFCDIGNTGGFILTKNHNFPFPENCKKIVAATDVVVCGEGNIVGLNTVYRVPLIGINFLEKYAHRYNEGQPYEGVMLHGIESTGEIHSVGVLKL